MLFYSPIAWLVLVIFTFQLADYFMGSVENLFRVQRMNIFQQGFTSSLFSSPFGEGLLPQLQRYLYLYIPLLTMGMMSRDLGSGSIKLLYSSPIKNTHIILGKYFSLMLFGLMLIAIAFVFVLWGSFHIKDFEWGLVLPGLLGLYLLICTYVAIGLFISSLTSYQVAAAIGSMAVLAALTYVSYLGQDIEFVRDITHWFGLTTRTNGFLNGIISSEDVLYFVLITLLFLSLSILRLNAIRQKADWRASFGKYAGVVVAAALLGYVTSRPLFMVYHDATDDKRNTLTVNSQRIVKQLKGGLTMTTFVNALDEMVSMGIPRMRIMDQNAFRQFARFKPEIKMKYVYYYATQEENADLDRRYPGLSPLERVGQIARVNQVDSALFMPLEKVMQQYPDVDLKSENYRMVRLLERASGERTFLRMFNDNPPHPQEPEISAAFKRLVNQALPVVAFLQGHGEREVTREGDRGYRRVAMEKTFRASLINNGFEFEPVELNAPIPEKITILVIADARTPILPEEEAYLNAYIARGGNLFILGETRRQESMNPLLERFGVRLMPGQLVQQTQMANLPDFILSRTTGEAEALSYLLSDQRDYRTWRMNRLNITMPGAVGIELIDDGRKAREEGFQPMPILVTDTVRCWNEVETTNFEDETPVLNEAAGEVEKSYITALALSRLHAGREQKIMIVGDADCISYAEVTMMRPGMMASNFNFSMGVFQWMSNGEVPVDVRRSTTTDDRLLLTKAGLKTSKRLLGWGLPLAMLLAYMVIWLRRRGR